MLDVAVVTALGLLAALPTAAVRLVPRRHCAVIERRHRLHRVAGEGLTALVPLVDRVRAVVDLRERVVPVPRRPLGTADHEVLTVGLTVRMRVTDPAAAGRVAPDLECAVARLAADTIAELVARLQLAEVAGTPAQLRRHLSAELGRATSHWGIQVVAVELDQGGMHPQQDKPAGVVPGRAEPWA
jgi:regulator of protease activity HflC (stomatin/prohibitin superfamily)